MPNLKGLRNRIKSVKSTQKITKAMKMVAASKLRRAREKAEEAAPYALRMERMLGSLAASITSPQGAPKLLTGNGRDVTHLVVVMSSDRGLCGNFNSSIVKAARLKITELELQKKNVKILCVGRKGKDLLRSLYRNNITRTIEGIGRKQVAYTEAEEIGQYLIEAFERGEFDVCTIIYNKFKSAIARDVTIQQLIPLDVTALTAASQNSGDVGSYEYEPSEAAILEDLLPRNISVQMYHALLENAASEQGARMTAMDNATRNAGEMIKKLTLVYNRTRQAVITKELIEIISGAEAI